MDIPEDATDIWLEQMKQGAINANKRTAEIAKTFAQVLSSGTLTVAQKRAMDYPFAKRHGEAKANLSIINVVTGNFRFMWATAPGIEGPMDTPEAGTRMGNLSEHAQYLEEGTTKMFARPLVEKIAQEVLPLRSDIMDEELKKVMK